MVTIYTKAELENTSTGPLKTNTENAIGSDDIRDTASSIMGCYGHLYAAIAPTALTVTPQIIEFVSAGETDEVTSTASAAAQILLSAAAQDGVYEIHGSLSGSLSAAKEITLELFLDGVAVTGAKVQTEVGAGDEFSIAIPVFPIALVNANFVDLRVYIDATTATLGHFSNSLTAKRIG